MHTLNHRSALSFARLTQALQAGAATLHAKAVLLDQWLLHRQRAARERQDLANMSDRDLMDIGVTRGSLEAISAGHWQRDLPC
jgi:uncharacterized protein YjiS (DUF1127 family)